MYDNQLKYIQPMCIFSRGVVVIIMMATLVRAEVNVSSINNTNTLKDTHDYLYFSQYYPNIQPYIIFTLLVRLLSSPANAMIIILFLPILFILTMIIIIGYYSILICCPCFNSLEDSPVWKDDKNLTLFQQALTKQMHVLVYLNWSSFDAWHARLVRQNKVNNLHTFTTIPPQTILTDPHLNLEPPNRWYDSRPIHYYTLLLHWCNVYTSMKETSLKRTKPQSS